MHLVDAHVVIFSTASAFQDCNKTRAKTERIVVSEDRVRLVIGKFLSLGPFVDFACVRFSASRDRRSCYNFADAGCSSSETASKTADSSEPNIFSSGLVQRASFSR